MRGKILGVDGTRGGIAGSDGKRYWFGAEDMEADRLAIGTDIEFDPDGENARRIRLAPVEAQAAPTGADASPTPLERGPFKYYVEAWSKNYARFEGRARRKEYWSFVLLDRLVGIGLSLPLLTVWASDGGTTWWTPLSGSPRSIYLICYYIYIIAATLPWLSVQVRRLHDVGISGHALWRIPAVVLALLLAGELTARFLIGFALILIGVIGIFAGAIFIFVMSLREGDPAANFYGSPPK